MKDTTKARTKWAIATLALLASAMQTGSATPNRPADDSKGKGKVVYVCACLKNKSCFCMTEAKTAGPCSCGTGGGPPMKAVPQNSDWAKANRDALAN